MTSTGLIPTPPGSATPSEKDHANTTSHYAALKNPTLPADGPGYDTFSHKLLASTMILAPAVATWKVGGGYITFALFCVVLQVPIAAAFWFVASRISPPVGGEEARTPGRPVEDYLYFKTEKDRERYWGRHKIPMGTFVEMYIGGDVQFRGDALDVLEMRHDWASWKFTWGLLRFVVFGLLPRIIKRAVSSKGQVKAKPELGSDFYSWFLGPRLLYNSGIVSDMEVEEPLRDLQDNKLAVVCEKIALRPGDRMLDLGCGWGALATFASVNYGADVNGTTLDQEQADLGSWRLREAGVSEHQSRICVAAGENVVGDRFDKITCLRTGEQLSGKRMGRFFEWCYEMLEDDGVMLLEVSGLRMAWQYEDLVWGLFLAKYIPGFRDMSPLPVYVAALEAAGFEIQSVDNVGHHYSATVWRWYKNWVGNAEEVKAKYGERLYRIWEYFLATATIMARQGTTASYQITLVKNLNGVSRVGTQGTRLSVEEALGRSRAAGKAVFPV